MDKKMRISIAFFLIIVLVFLSSALLEKDCSNEFDLREYTTDSNEVHSILDLVLDKSKPCDDRGADWHYMISIYREEYSRTGKEPFRVSDSISWSISVFYSLKILSSEMHKSVIINTRTRFSFLLS
jgi:hypothetical protein